MLKEGKKIKLDLQPERSQKSGIKKKKTANLTGGKKKKRTFQPDHAVPRLSNSTQKTTEEREKEGGNLQKCGTSKRQEGLIRVL